MSFISFKSFFWGARARSLGLTVAILRSISRSMSHLPPNPAHQSIALLSLLGTQHGAQWPVATAANALLDCANLQVVSAAAGRTTWAGQQFQELLLQQKWHRAVLGQGIWSLFCSPWCGGAMFICFFVVLHTFSSSARRTDWGRLGLALASNQSLLFICNCFVLCQPKAWINSPESVTMLSIH